MIGEIDVHIYFIVLSNALKGALKPDMQVCSHVIVSHLNDSDTHSVDFSLMHVITLERKLLLKPVQSSITCSVILYIRLKSQIQFLCAVLHLLVPSLRHFITVAAFK